MATLREYFDTDKPTMVHLSSEGKMSLFNQETLKIAHPEVSFIAKRTIDQGSATIYYSFYIKNCQEPLTICFEILRAILDDRIQFDGGLEVQWISHMPTEFPINSIDFKFIGRVIFYCESPITNDKFNELYKAALEKGLIIHYRGPEYMNDRAKTEKPLAFISHDSRDKEIARKIAIELNKVYCPVWYDEFSLKIGDRLRESIENGLKNCQKCIILLSPNFTSNLGWTREEFDSVFTREILEKQDVILPIWLNISAKEIYNYSPSLANRVAVVWNSENADEIINKLRSVIIKE